jgi:dimethylargininase
MPESAAELVAITHLPSPKLDDGQRTYVGRDAVDMRRALRQHEQYQNALRKCGATVLTLDANRDLPDCVFVEDTAIVLDEVAVMMSMGAESRRNEPAAIEAALRAYRPIDRVALPATIDGGDVVRSGRSLYVGLSPRTNAAGISALRDVVARYGYTVTAIPVHSCLHLKTACSALPDGRFLVNREWIDVSALAGNDLVPVPEGEPWAGDVLVIDSNVILADTFPETAALLADCGFNPIPVNVSEFAKVEGGVTCLSLVFRTTAVS